MDTIVTTVQRASEDLEKKAKTIADKLKGTYLERCRLKGISSCEAPILVVAKEGINLHYNDEKFFFHPSMAMLRIKRIMKGEKDIFNTICGDIRGYSVLDCTMGFGSDSLVFSYLVEELGCVTALEINTLIYTIISDGLKNSYPKWDEINATKMNIRTYNLDYHSYLDSCTEKNHDIVYFDPMFDEPLTESVHLDPIRALAQKDQLTVEVIDRAKMVASKFVIVKNRVDYDFNKLGIYETFSKSSSKIKYGIVRL